MHIAILYHDEISWLSRKCLAKSKYAQNRDFIQIEGTMKIGEGLVKIEVRQKP